MNRIFLPILLFLFTSCAGYQKHEVNVLPAADKIKTRTLFIAFDGISFDMMQDLQKKGHFSEFVQTAPLTVTFPSATTIGFTGIFKPLDVGKVPGYEVRFYSFDEGRVIGGTPKDIYKIPINYKYYFDSFRHTVFEKSIMYTFPGVAGKQDLLRTRDLLLKSDKNILFTYLGGTDGSQHMLGKRRTERFMIYADRFLKKMREDYKKQGKGDLRIVLFSDHGFHFDDMKMIWTDDFEKKLKPAGFKINKTLVGAKDVVLVKFGLLSAGVMMTAPKDREAAARLIRDVRGMDLVFWPDGKKIRVINDTGEEAYFEYDWPRRSRYVSVKGDPLHYQEIFKRHKISAGSWIKDKKFYEMTWDAQYPDASYRLYDSFHNLVKNEASVLFSLKPPYQFGGLAAFAATQLKPGGHRGTHGGLFREPSWGMVMTDDRKVKLPKSVRYDDLFKIFLPPVTKAYQRRHGQTEFQVLVGPENH